MRDSDDSLRGSSVGRPKLWSSGVRPDEIQVGVQKRARQKLAKFGEYSGRNKLAASSSGTSVCAAAMPMRAATEPCVRWVSPERILVLPRGSSAPLWAARGSWNLNFGHDELRHNITDSYQTPQQGSMGGNVFHASRQLSRVQRRNNRDPQPRYRRAHRAIPASALHTEEVGSTRKNTSFGAGFRINPQLSLQFDYNHLAQSGAKLMSSATLGGIVTGGVGSFRAEAIAVLISAWTNYKTDTYSLALNWVGDRGTVRNLLGVDLQGRL